MSPTTLRIISFIGCIVLVFQAKELSITILRWFARWVKDGILPVELPPSGSIWLQNSAGMSWGTTGHRDGELDPFSKWPPSYDVWFRPGSQWLVLDSGESSRDDWWWIDLLKMEDQGHFSDKVRIFANRHAMQEWRSTRDGRMLRIDE